ncbi:hypothetical protein JCM5353_006437 [Sporobolomyces roseus]
MELVVSGILFDSDGTLIDSTPSVLRVMSLWCTTQSIELRQFISEAQHGTRTKDILRKYQRVPKIGSEMSEEELDWEVKRLEGMVVEMGKAMERNGTGTGVRALPGVKEFLGKLREVEFKNFGVVTSATRVHALPALELAGIGEVPFVISGEQVEKGKPHPEPYLAGIERFRLLSSSNDPIDPSTVLVVEDAPAGFVSGIKAGCQVLAVCSGPTPAEKVKEAAKRIGGIRVVRDLRDVEVVGMEEGKLRLRINEIKLDSEEAQT